MAQGQWTEVEARAVLAAWRKSGQSVQAFAKERGIVPQRLRWWKAKLDGKSTAVSARAEIPLVPVRVVDAKRGEPVVVLLRSGHMVKVGRGFDEVALARVVAVLDEVR